MLMLRKDCQPILNAIGFEKAHVEIKHRVLILVGDCGRPITTVSGITFSKNTINSAERKYALELFTEFIDLHKSLFATLKTVKQELDLYVPFVLPIGVSKEYKKYKIKMRASKGYLEVLKDEELISIMGMEKDTIPKVLNYYDTLKPVFIDYEINMEQKEELDNRMEEITTKLSTCSI